MARERMVTRTVSETTVTVMCVNVTTAEMENKVYTLGQVSNQSDALKALKKLYETDTFKLVAIVSMTVSEQLYGMTEVEFIKLARKLPPRSGATE